MRFSVQPNRSVLGWVGRACLPGLLLLTLVLVPACGGDAGVDQAPGSGEDSSPPFSAAPQSPSKPQGAGDAPGSGPAAATDPGKGSVAELGTEPSVSNDPIPTWAVTPGVDPDKVNDMKGTPSPVPTDAAPSERPSDAPQAPGDDLRELVEGNAGFAFDLYRELSASDGNLFFSPHSISTALAMTYGGAGGDTETAMSEVLRFPLPPERLHTAFGALAGDLKARTDDDEGFRLEVVNAVWGQEGHPFLDSYLDLLEGPYEAGVRWADFVGSPEGSRDDINRRVAERTEGRIEDLIPEGVIDSLTRMVLTNAVYFKANWRNPFEKRLTGQAPFHLLDGGTVDVPMMRATEYFGYVAGDGYRVVELPYEGGGLSMTVLLPDQGGFEEFQERLDAGYVGGIMADVSETYVALEMPRFEFDADFLLGETLSGMGMSSAFDPAAADFSGMDGRSCLAGGPGCLYVREVVHKGFVSVDEAGTEAAAATGVVVQTESAKPEPVRVTVDRPFIFLIRDRATGTILFLGRVVEP